MGIFSEITLKTMEDQINIQDESGDRKYFTQIPNYIANHSTANDQALYFQMKRYAGENGKCFATQETIMKKMGIGRLTYNKSLQYLLDQKWIRFVGMTKSKTRPIKTYAIVDIWKLNVSEYEKIPSETALSFEKIPSETNKDTVQNSSKIPSETAIEEEPIKEEPLRRRIQATLSVANPEKQEINLLIEKFKPVNPSYGRLFGNKTQRACLTRLLKQMGRERLEQAIDCLPQIFGKPYSPVITTPYQLEQKMGQLISYLQQQKDRMPFVVDIGVE